MALAIKIKDGRFDRIPERYSDELQRVISWMLTLDQAKRACIDDLINLPLVSIRLREKRFEEKQQFHFQLLKKKEQEIAKKEEKLAKRERLLLEKEKALACEEAKIAAKHQLLKHRENELKDIKQALERQQNELTNRLKQIHTEAADHQSTPQEQLTLDQQRLNLIESALSTGFDSSQADPSASQPDSLQSASKAKLLQNYSNLVNRLHQRKSPTHSNESKIESRYSSHQRAISIQDSEQLMASRNVNNNSRETLRDLNLLDSQNTQHYRHQ